MSWTFRGGMDLRDEVSGTEGTIRLDHFLRTGFEMFTATGEGGYVAEKAEGQTGWLFPVGDEANELGYVHMFQDMLDAWESGRAPMETFYDGYIVNAIIDACYRSMKSGRWEPVKAAFKAPGRPQEGKISVDQGVVGQGEREGPSSGAGAAVIKTERLPDGRVKRILKDTATGRIVEKIS